MCDKAVNTYPSTIELVLECYKVQKICDKAFNKCLFVFDCILDQYKTQEMCDTVVSNDPPLLVYCPDEYITQKMWDEAVDYSLAVLKLLPNWFVTSKTIKKLFTASYTDKDVYYFNEDSGDAVFNFKEIGILNIDLNNISLDVIFDEDDPNTIFF